MKAITNNTEFIIGIDFGHGETSASFYSLQSNVTEKTKDLNITPGKSVIKSAVAILRQEGIETIAVGDKAIQDAPFAKDFQISFKKRPSEMNDVERGRMVAFMKGVYDGILEQYPDYKSREHVVYIARPSQDKLWQNEESEYIRIAEDAGLPVAGIQKESRAAYFRARTQPDSKIDSQLDEGVLIVDFGSSTIDFTYLNKDLKQPIDDGVNLGASEVEETLLRYSFLHPMDDDPTLSEFYKKFGENRQSNAYNQLLYRFRDAKEKFYENKQSFFGLDYRYTDLTAAEDYKLSGRGGVSYSRKEVRRILTEEFDKYIPRVEAAVRMFKDQKLKDKKVACVYLTGGASQMDFVREIFMKVFNLSEERCPKDGDASVIVSQGVAHLSFADFKTQEKEKELREKVKTILDGFNWTKELNAVIYPIIQKEIKSKAHSVMLAWKEGEITGIGENGYVCPTIEALIEKFKQVFGNYRSYDFAESSKSIIKKQVIDKVVNRIRDTFSDYQYRKELGEIDFSVNISARLWYSGINKLVEKFTKEGDGHLIYDAVAASSPFGMDGWNLKRHRSALALQRHYNHYPYSIFNDNEWISFLKNDVHIEGVDAIKNDVTLKIQKLMDNYISYAKLAMFYK